MRACTLCLAWPFASPWTVALQAPLWSFPGKDIGMSSHSLLQGIFLTRGLNPHLLQLPALAGRFVTTVLPGRGTGDQIANIRWIMGKARGFQKNIYFCFIDYPKPLTVWITINCRKFWKRWEYQTTWPASWETYTQVRKQQLELDMDQQTGSK